MSDDRFQLQRLLEAILFASSEPLGVDALKARMPEDTDIPGLLEEIRDHYANRGVNLTVVEGRWCFRTATDLASKFHIEQKVERKLTRAAIETLAIVAYHQPVTRAEIEEIRGVVISKGTLDNLLEAGWIKPKGRRQTPGRPVTWVTTESFLEHFGLESCDALPGVEELRAAGLLDSRNNSATLGVQGTLPPNGEVAEDEDEDDDFDDERSAGLADDAYEAGVLARLEGAEVVADGVVEGAVETDVEAEAGEPDAAAIAEDDGELASLDDVTGDELSEEAQAARIESDADLAEERDDPDVAEIADESIPDELLDTTVSTEDAADDEGTDTSDAEEDAADGRASKVDAGH
jgi:segregation and condensation protein B